MREWLLQAVHTIGIVIELMAVVIIAYAALEAFVQLVRVVVSHVPLDDRRSIWLRFLRLLVVGMTFQLAADLVHIAMARDWESIGHVAAIAALRTFLAYFLDRDVRAATLERGQ